METMETIPVTYHGPEAEVDVPDLNATVKHGDTIDVPADAAKNLLEQPRNWKRSESKSQKAAREKAEREATEEQAAADKAAAEAVDRLRAERAKKEKS